MRLTELENIRTCPEEAEARRQNEARERKGVTTREGEQRGNVTREEA